MSALDELSGKTPAPVRGCASVLGGTLLVSAILLTSDTLIDQIAQTGASAGSFLISLSYLLFPATVSLATVALVFRCRDDRAVSRIALGLLAVSLLSRLVWISIFDSYQVNDFGYYLQCGADVLREGTPADSGFCDGPYWKRTVFYTLPLVRAFGQSLPALELANVLLATGAGWIFFLVCRMNFGARAAAIALLFFVWNPDLWYSVTLASHDIPGLFWLSIFYYLCSLLQRRLTDPSKGLPGLIVLALCLGGVIFFLDFSRSYHIGAILALVLYAAVAPAISRAASMRLRIRTAALRATFLLVIPLCAYRLACAGFWKVSPVEPGQGETGETFQNPAHASR